MLRRRVRLVPLPFIFAFLAPGILLEIDGISQLPNQLIAPLNLRVYLLLLNEIKVDAALFEFHRRRAAAVVLLFEVKASQRTEQSAYLGYLARLPLGQLLLLLHRLQHRLHDCKAIEYLALFQAKTNKLSDSFALKVDHRLSRSEIFVLSVALGELEREKGVHKVKVEAEAVGVGQVGKQAFDLAVHVGLDRGVFEVLLR